MNDWPSIQEWRIATRRDLAARRLGISPQERQSAQQLIVERIRSNFPELNEAAIGFYWPIKGEIDLRLLLADLQSDGADAALPVVVEKDLPLEFWDWHSDAKMSRGVWDILVPRERKLVQPTVLLVPLLGFDEAGHRLGNGGGCYDRTLAAFRLKPLTIGIGYDFGRLQSIHPQEHDVPMDAIVTETRCTRFDHDRTFVSSPPCYSHEFEDE